MVGDETESGICGEDREDEKVVTRVVTFSQKNTYIYVSMHFQPN